MNINHGQKGEETWEWEAATGYNTPQDVTPSAEEKQGRSRGKKHAADLHQDTRHLYVFGGRNSSAMWGLKGEDINDIKVIWELTSACMPCSYLAFIGAPHCADTEDIYTQTGFMQM